MERCEVREQNPGGTTALKYGRLGNLDEMLDSPLHLPPPPPVVSLPRLRVSSITAIYPQTGPVNLPLFLQFKPLPASQIAALLQFSADQLWRGSRGRLSSHLCSQWGRDHRCLTRNETRFSGKMEETSTAGTAAHSRIGCALLWGPG